MGVVVPSDALWRGASYYLQSPAFLASAAVESDTGNPLAGATAPSGWFLTWALLYASAWAAVADRWFRRRDL